MYLMLIDSDLPEGMHLHHECDQAWCVNPYHLTPLTPSEHALLHAPRPRARKRWCVNGHDRTDPANIDLVQRGSKVERQCRLCKAEWKRRKRAEAKAALTA